MKNKYGFKRGREMRFYTETYTKKTSTPEKLLMGAQF